MTNPHPTIYVKYVHYSSYMHKEISSSLDQKKLARTHFSLSLFSIGNNIKNKKGGKGGGLCVDNQIS